MSDDEEVPALAKRQKILHYGSLEDAEKLRLAAEKSTGTAVSSAIEAGKEAGNINITDGKPKMQK